MKQFRLIRTADAQIVPPVQISEGAAGLQACYLEFSRAAGAWRECDFNQQQEIYPARCTDLLPPISLQASALINFLLSVKLPLANPINSKQQACSASILSNLLFFIVQ